MKRISWKTAGLYIALALNFGLLLLHLESYFSHAEIISVKDGFYFRPIRPNDPLAAVQFPQVRLVRASQGSGIYQIVPSKGYSLCSVQNIRSYETSKKASFSIPIDFNRVVFYQMEKGDRISLKGQQIPYRLAKKNPIICPGTNRPGLIISTDSLTINDSRILGPGAYIRIGTGRTRVLVGLRKDDQIQDFELFGRGQYLILSRVAREFRCPMSAGEPVLFNTDNARDPSLVLEQSSTKGLLFRAEERRYFFRTLGAGAARAPQEILRNMFLLDDALVEINPNGGGQKLLMFLAINLLLILALAFDKKIVPSLDMKIVILLALFLFSLNFFLAFDIYHRFDYGDFFSERLNLIPLLILLLLVLADSIKRARSFFFVGLGLIGLQLAISQIDPGNYREHAFYMMILAALSWLPMVNLLRRYAWSILKWVERKEFGELLAAIPVLFVGILFGLVFKEAVQIGGFRLELSSLLKLPIIYFYAICFFFAYRRIIKLEAFRTYVIYLALFTLPAFLISLVNGDQGSFMLITMFTVIMIIFLFPGPETGDPRTGHRTEIRLKMSLAVSILVLFAGLLLAGKPTGSSYHGVLNMKMITNLYARTLHPSSDLRTYETTQYQRNLVSQSRWIGTTAFEVDRAMLHPYLLNDYVFVYLLPRLGYLCGAIVILTYVGILFFGLRGLKSFEGSFRFKSARLFFVIGLSYFVFQSLYQLISQLGGKWLPFTGKEAYLLSAGRSQAVVFFFFLAMLNYTISRKSPRENA